MPRTPSTDPTASTASATALPRLPAGLVYVNPATLPGFSRVRDDVGKDSRPAFRYRDANGAWLKDEEVIRRIQRLAIPPAYTDVWICPLENGHLQATGRDARGRVQYRYHAQWRELRDEAKFERMQEFGRALPRIRTRIARDLRPRRGQPPLARTVVLATIVRLLDTTFLRVGNEEYASTNGSYGLTTLRNRHAGVRGSKLTLRFRGKSGVQQEARLEDPRVARVVRQCQQLPGQELFQYQDEAGELHAVGSGDVNDYLAEMAGEGASRFTAKDFRTWHGTVQALELTRLACHQQDGAAHTTAKEILVEVARQLGNTPAVCRKSYIHPAVLDLGQSLASDSGPGLQRMWDRVGGGPATRGLSAAERRLMRFLASHQRRARRAGAVKATSGKTATATSGKTAGKKPSKSKSTT